MDLGRRNHSILDLESARVCTVMATARCAERCVHGNAARARAYTASYSAVRACSSVQCSTASYSLVYIVYSAVLASAVRT